MKLGKVARISGQRLYSAKTKAAIPAQPGRTQFDKSMLKPALVIIIFGSMLSHVSTQEKRHAELERRFDLKADILSELIERAKNGDTDFDVDKELSLVNKVFSRYEKSQNIDISEEATKLRNVYDTQTYSRKEVLESLNSSTGATEEESLDDLFRSIIEEVDETSANRKHTGEISIKLEKSQRDTQVENADGIIMDKRILNEEAAKENDSKEYEPSTEIHLIVENPGELSEVAKETKVTKFL